MTHNADLITLIDNLLPQTQCGECGHPGCLPYAEAIANGEAINRCPPGGNETIAALANLLGMTALPLDGTPRPDSVAYIRENECIGCTLCIQACPVDAILGAAKLMHTVIAEECTGCDLCVEPCPVDCIEMRPPNRVPRPAHFRQRFIAHNARIAYENNLREQRRAQRAEIVAAKVTANVSTKTAIAVNENATSIKTKQDEIRAAIARAKAKKIAASKPDRQ